MKGADKLQIVKELQTLYKTDATSKYQQLKWVYISKAIVFNVEKVVTVEIGNRIHMLKECYC